MPFRNREPNAPTATLEKITDPNQQLPRHELTLQLSIPTELPAEQQIVRDEPPIPTVEVAKPIVQAQESPTAEVKAPPALASTFEPLSTTILDMSEADTLHVAAPSPNRVHRIADGDTLESLAQRYLGASRRWKVIFNANADVLSDPQLLPIGTEIEIPPISEATTSEATASNDGLVPVPPVSADPRS